MEVLLENIIIYGGTLLLVTLIFLFYLKTTHKRSKRTNAKIQKAKEAGLYEPVSLHPVIDPGTCIGSGACIEACPEKDILGWVSGKSKCINTSRCVGHGACFHACPVQAISLVIGTEKRGVELPHVSQEFETNVPGVFIAGELGGMGLIKNAVEQGKQAVENITKKISKSGKADFDIAIIGAGPSGISATLTAKKNKLRYITFEQDTLGGTVFSFPRAKVVMTSPMDLPLYGKLKLFETSKTELISIWRDVIQKNDIKINEQEKVESISKEGDYFSVTTTKGNYKASSILLTIGRRGTPRKLGAKGENKEKVYYRLLEPELIHNQHVLVVGGGDSAIESAMLMADEKNHVTLSYRSDKFSRIKPKNYERIEEYSKSKKLNVTFNSVVEEIFDDKVSLIINGSEKKSIRNDLVYVFAGGELPTQFLEKIGIKITKKFGEVILSHNN
ncbi:MAG: 4Fe-4S ferredoxin [Ignavibacteriales bacterium CG_4_9_14_3_um_filter_34_10]|nr:MAG: 4Fe-4S ferredoxin [Ignavibacteriales bacterium CG_4_9_14_3_um_filter_34_10]